jgi:hypothetical protein
LVLDGSACGADAGDDEGRCGEASAEGGDFFGTCDESVDARFRRGVGQAEDLILRGVVDADGGELELIHAGEDGDGQELRRVGDGRSGFGGGFEHGGSASGVDGEKLGTDGGGRTDGSCNGVGDVVEFEVEENGEAAAAEFADDGGAFGGVEFEADLEPAAEAVELVGEGEGWVGAGGIEGDDEALVHENSVQGTGCWVQPGARSVEPGDRGRRRVRECDA